MKEKLFTMVLLFAILIINKFAFSMNSFDEYKQYIMSEEFKQYYCVSQEPDEEILMITGADKQLHEKENLATADNCFIHETIKNEHGKNVRICLPNKSSIIILDADDLGCTNKHIGFNEPKKIDEKKFCFSRVRTAYDFFFKRNYSKSKIRIVISKELFEKLSAQDHLCSDPSCDGKCLHDYNKTFVEWAIQEKILTPIAVNLDKVISLFREKSRLPYVVRSNFAWSEDLKYAINHTLISLDTKFFATILPQSIKATFLPAE